MYYYLTKNILQIITIILVLICPNAIFGQATKQEPCSLLPILGNLRANIKVEFHEKIGQALQENPICNYRKIEATEKILKKYTVGLNNFLKQPKVLKLIADREKVEELYRFEINDRGTHTLIQLDLVLKNGTIIPISNKLRFDGYTDLNLDFVVKEMTLELVEYKKRVALTKLQKKYQYEMQEDLHKAKPWFDRKSFKLLTVIGKGETTAELNSAKQVAGPIIGISGEISGWRTGSNWGASFMYRKRNGLYSKKFGDLSPKGANTNESATTLQLKIMHQYGVPSIREGTLLNFLWGYKKVTFKHQNASEDGLTDATFSSPFLGLRGEYGMGNKWMAVIGLQRLFFTSYSEEPQTYSSSSSLGGHQFEIGLLKKIKKNSRFYSSVHLLSYDGEFNNNEERIQFTEVVLNNGFIIFF